MMLVERTEIEVRPESGDAFDAAMIVRAVPVLEAVPGVEAVRYGRGVENPSKFILLITWETMEAHHAYHGTPASTEIRTIISAHATGAAMEHFEITS